MDELKNKKIHFIGIGGISMSALAQILLKERIYVQGSDESLNSEVLKLKKKGVLIFHKHLKSNLQNIDIVVYSSAISDDNPELIFAKNKNLLILKRAELLSIIAEKYNTVISISGSHGKTTTAALVSEIFINAKLKPTVHIGGVLNKINSNYLIGDKKFFITESCEYKDNFLYLCPNISVILNIDADHLDYFKSLNGVKKSFCKFSKNTKDGGINIICCEDKNSKALLKNANNIGFGLKNGIIHAKNIKKIKNEKYSFDVIFCDCCIGNIELNIFGKYNIYNVLSAILVGLVCGIDFNIIKQSIENFGGVERRFEFIGKYNDIDVYHDYAHHPKQIKKVVHVCKRIAKEKGGKLYVVYEPHTYSRTKYLINEFSRCFNECDVVLLLPVYSAREKISDGFDSEKLLQEIKKNNYDNCFLCDSYKAVENYVSDNCISNDVLMILGAGSIEKIAKNIKKQIKE